MLKSLLNYIEENNLIKENDKILVSFSGGPDSAFLLHFLSILQKNISFSFSAAYLNHMLRGKESEREEKFVSLILANYKIKLYKKQIDIKKIVSKNKNNLESEARLQRYKFLKECFKKNKFNKIATGHNKDDNAETIFMNLLRGCGINGIKGISFNKDMNIIGTNLKIIRPLINIEKKDIIKYCDKNNIKYIIDSSNLKTDFTRNKIRLEIFPLLEKEINKKIKDNLISFSNIASKYYDYVLSVTDNLFNKSVKKENNKFVLNIEVLKKESIIIIELLKKIVLDISAGLDILEKSHINEIFKIIKSKKPNIEIVLFKEIIFEKIYDKLFIYKKFLIKKKEKINKRIKIKVEGITKISNFKIETKFVNKIKNIKKISSKNLIFCDYDKIKGNLFIRKRKSGDKFIPFGMNKEKKIKDFFINNKVSKKIRDNTFILCDEEKIIWICGFRMDERMRLKENSKNILKIIINN